MDTSMDTFYMWIKKQHYRDDAVGNFSRYITYINSATIPKAAMLLEMWIDYIKSVGSAGGGDKRMIDYCKKAWKEYKFIVDLEMTLTACRIAVKYGIRSATDKDLEIKVMTDKIDDYMLEDKLHDIRSECQSIMRNAVHALDLVQSFEKKLYKE